jgi:ribosomal protein S21
MIVVRKEKETNQQVLRRFNRIMQTIKHLLEVREGREFVKDPNRFSRRASAVRKDKLRRSKQWY